jgi:copper chaperone
MTKEATMETLAMKVGGMSCNGCVATVARVLKGVPGVQQAEVTLKPPEAKITFDPAVTNAAALRTAVENAGYDVAG